MRGDRLLLLGAAGAMAAIVIAFFALRPQPVAPVDEIERTAARIGLPAMLADSYGIVVEEFLLGVEASDGLWDFRGVTDAASDRKVFYGAAQRTCEPAQSANARCWRATELSVDGVARDVATGATEAAGGVQAAGGASAAALSVGPVDEDPALASEPSAGADALATQTSADAPIAPAPSEDVTAADATADVPAVDVPAVPEPAAVATHRTSGRANLRTGPGLEHGSIGLIEADQTLSRIEAVDGWARFRVLGGDFDGVEAWISGSLVAPL